MIIDRRELLKIRDDFINKGQKNIEDRNKIDPDENGSDTALGFCNGYQTHNLETIKMLEDLICKET